MWNDMKSIMFQIYWIGWQRDRCRYTDTQQRQLEVSEMVLRLCARFHDERLLFWCLPWNFKAFHLSSAVCQRLMNWIRCSSGFISCKFRDRNSSWCDFRVTNVIKFMLWCEINNQLFRQTSGHTHLLSRQVRVIFSSFSKRRRRRKQIQQY